MLFSFSLFKNETLANSLMNIPPEFVYKSIPEFVFTDPVWFYHTEKHLTSVLTNMSIGESYKVAWSKDATHYLLLTRIQEPITIISDEDEQLRNRRMNTPLPISDDEDDKYTKYSVVCSRYLSFFIDWFNNKPLLPK